jgi:hypothetical protein
MWALSCSSVGMAGSEGVAAMMGVGRATLQRSPGCRRISVIHHDLKGAERWSGPDGVRQL